MTSSRGRSSSRLLEGRCSWECVRIFCSAWANCFCGIGGGSNLFVRDQDGAFWPRGRSTMTSHTTTALTVTRLLVN